MENNGYNAHFTVNTIFCKKEGKKFNLYCKNKDYTKENFFNYFLNTYNFLIIYIRIMKLQWISSCLARDKKRELNPFAA